MTRIQSTNHVSDIEYNPSEYSKLAAISPVIRQHNLITTLLDTMKSVSFNNLFADTAAWINQPESSASGLKTSEKSTSDNMNQSPEIELLKSKSKIVFKNKSTLTVSPLLYAILENKTRTAETLLKQGAQLGEEAPKALMSAISHNNLRMVTLICEHIPLQNEFLNKHPEISPPKTSPLLLAVKRHCAGIAEYLVKKGADIHQFCPGEPTPLCVAIKSKNPQMVAALIKNVTDLDIAGNTS